MAMQVNGNYEHSGIDYAERVKKKQAVWRAEKAKETEQAAEGFCICISIKEIQIFSVVSIPEDGGKYALFSGIFEISLFLYKN